ncbi:hypothetical protein C2S51_038883, partial [Perilla frutescens var. frutescens]
SIVSLPRIDYVFRYLEAEQIGAIVREQEKKATWKTEQLQHIRESEEKKRQRNLQVEKMKAEMLNLQIQLHRLRAEKSILLKFTKHTMDASTSGITELRDEAGDNPVNDSDEAKKGSQQSRDFLNISPEDSDSNEPPYYKRAILFAFHGLLGGSVSICSLREYWAKLYLLGYNANLYRIYILVQYLYQITIQHCGFSIQSDLLRELGFPTKKIISIRYQFATSVFGVSIHSNTELYYCKMVYWKSLTQEAESPPYFIQLSMDVKAWPEDGIQPERIESGINQLLQLVHDETCKNEMPNCCPCASKSVIKNKSEFLEYYQLEDQFRKNNLFLIVVDRVIYLCSFATGKSHLYIFSIFLFTYAVTEYAWDMDTSQQNTAGLALRAIYLTKAVSLALQAMQIRYVTSLTMYDWLKSFSQTRREADKDDQVLQWHLSLFHSNLCYLGSNAADLLPSGCKFSVARPWCGSEQFIQSLYSAMDMKFAWILTRDRPKGKEKVYNIYPRIFRVTGAGEVRPFDQESFVNADLVLHHEEYEWWSFQDINPPDADACGGLSGPMAVIVSEETPRISWRDPQQFSIWGLYITFVLAVGRFIRMQCSDLRMRIPFENLPSCDRLIAICEDIYAARAEGELGVEEVLYWTLVKIYRRASYVA